MKTVFGHTAPLPGNDAEAHPMDLVKMLGRTRRFGGNADLDWSVLHHSMLCAILWLQRYGPSGVHHALLHDAHEYVTGDIPSPVKAAIGKEHIAKVEDFIDRRIYEMVDEEAPDDLKIRHQIKIIDLAALFIEAKYVGLPGHVQHIVDTSILHMAPSMRREVWITVLCMCPDVSDEMDDAGFLNAPYEEAK